MSEELQLNTGAASALAWISKQEAACRKRYEECAHTLEELTAERNGERDLPPARDGAEATDYDELIRKARSDLDDAEARVQRWQKGLREYDKSVSEEKRDSTEKMTREEVERFFKMLCITENSLTEDFITRFCQGVLELQNAQDVYAFAAQSLRDCKRNAIEAAIGLGHLPLWLKTTIEEVF